MAVQQDGGQEEQWTDTLSQSDATELDNALFFDYEYSIDQLMEIAGLCIAQVNHTNLNIVSAIAPNLASNFM